MVEKLILSNKNKHLKKQNNIFNLVSEGATKVKKKKT